MKRIIYASALLLLAGLMMAPVSFAQQTASLSGLVTDGTDGAPLAGANVRLEGADGAMVGGAATDLDGRYRITGLRPGAYTARVTFIGYQAQAEPVALSAGEAATRNFTLQPGGIDLNTVIVTASRQAEKVLDAPASISVIEAREIEQEVAPTPTQALRNTTGLDMAQTGVDRAEIVLRGFNNAFSGAAYVLTDYRQAAVASLGVNVHSLMPLLSQDIAQVEIVRGPGSALYGAGVDAGVIHFLTKDPFTYPGTSIALMGGERSFFGGEFRHAGVVNDRVGYKITGAYGQAEDWAIDPTDPVNAALLAQEVVARSNDYEKMNLTGLLQYRFNDRTTLSANAGFASATSTVLSGIGTLQAVDFGYSYGQLRLQAGDFFAQAYFNRNNAGDSFNYGQASDPACTANCDPLNVIDNGIVYNAQAQYDFAFMEDRHRLIVGADAELTRPDTEGTILGRNENETISEVGLYAQTTSSVTSKFDLTLALRGDYNNIVEEVQVSPRAALVFKATPQHTFRATYNRAFSSPGTNSNFLDIVARRVGPLTVRGRGAAFGYTFERNPAFLPFAGSDLVASSMLPGMEGAQTPVGLPLDVVYGLLYQGVAAMDLATLTATLQAQGLPVNEQLVGQLVALLSPSQTMVGGFSPGTLILPSLSGGPTQFVSGVTDIQPLKQTTSQTFEVGYKGLLNDRVLLAVDGYYTTKKDFIGPLGLETPLVIVPGLSNDLTRAITEGIANNATLAGALQQFGLTPQQVAGLLVTLAGGQLPGPNTPVAIVDPVENKVGAGTLPELMLTYRNFGELDYWGIDASFQYLATDRINLFGSVSVVSDDFFDASELGEEDESLTLALNAPTFKTKAGFSYNQPQGVTFNASGRYIEGFPVQSGPYEGFIDSYFLLDVGAGYDFDRYAPGLRLDVTVLNVLDNAHAEFVGAPELGRMAMARLTYSL